MDDPEGKKTPKLASKMAKALHLMLNKMKKRESYYFEVNNLRDNSVCPLPREAASLTNSNERCYLIGGVNYEAVDAVDCINVINDHVIWS